MGKQTKTQRRQSRSKYKPHTGKKQIARDLERAKGEQVWRSLAR